MDEPTIQTKRRRYSAEQKQTILAAYKQRTTTQGRFCKEHGLCIATLAFWLRKSREGNTAEGFVELSPAHIGSADECVHLELRDGTVLRIAVGTDPRWLRQLLLVLRCGA
jgi:transposase-like protein